MWESQQAIDSFSQTADPKAKIKDQVNNPSQWTHPPFEVHDQ